MNATAPTQEDWDRQLERLPGLMNIARVSLLLSLVTFHVLVSTYGDEIGLKLRALPVFSAPFYLWAVVYGTLILISLFAPNWQRQGTQMPNARAVADITMIAWLMHIGGGVGSGLGILILPFLVTSCLMSYGRYSLLYASYAVMLLLLSTSMLYWPFKDDSDASFMVQTVVLSGSCYLVAVLTSFSASFLNKATSSLSRHRRAFDRLKGLNELVLNHVNEAVVVLDVGQRVWLMNRQAQNYFPWLQREQQAPAFAWLVQRWQRYPSRAFVTRTEIDGQAVQIRARPLVREDESLLMLFIRSQKDLAAEALSTKLAALGQLTANLAHEIRNPLSAIRQSNGLLSEDNDNPLTAKLHGIIDNNIARIDKMLEEVSSLNKSDRLNPETINLMAFWLAFKNEFLLIRPQAAPCIRFHMENGGSPVKVRFDSAHLQQILWNLLNNAWQHGSQQKGSITVLVKPLQDRHAVSLMVIDDGPGVPAENQAQLFEPFFTTRAEGTGLGLYVARELAHANLGQLDYHPAVKGFELILPRENDE